MLTDLLRDPTSLAVFVGLPVVTAIGGAWVARRSARVKPAEVKQKAVPAVDPITGLVGRERFEALLTDRTTAAERMGSDLCVLSAGLDGFRLVNDTHGRDTGDKLLRLVAERLRRLCGPSTPLCRMDGDEFVIAFDAPREASEVLARRMVEAFGDSIQIDGKSISVGMSIGIAVSPEHGSGLRLVGNAEAAMRAAKRSGGGTHAMFDPRIESQHREEFSIAGELRQAIVKREFELLYQPKIDANSLQITAVEALLRWRHPTLGVVSPVRFIPIAERHGLIESIGNWVLEAALKQAAVWRKAGLRMRVAINVSGYQMRQDNFAVNLEKGLKKHGLQPGRFTCEITESVAMEDTAVTRRAFARLSKIGVHVSIDDFGTGYSSLSTLRRLPAQELKIDRAFVTDIVQSDEARAIVRAVIQMARALNLKVVAEGVETEAQRDLLVRLGCDELQGYLFAKPMSARGIAIWASDAPKTLAQSFRPSLFKETLPNDMAPTEVLHRATVLKPRNEPTAPLR